jgi:hypothetical protein
VSLSPPGRTAKRTCYLAPLKNQFITGLCYADRAFLSSDSKFDSRFRIKYRLSAEAQRFRLQWHANYPLIPAPASLSRKIELHVKHLTTYEFSHEAQFDGFGATSRDHFQIFFDLSSTTPVSALDECPSHLYRISPD